MTVTGGSIEVSNETQDTLIRARALMMKGNIMNVLQDPDKAKKVVDFIAASLFPMLADTEMKTYGGQRVSEVFKKITTELVRQIERK